MKVAQIAAVIYVLGAALVIPPAEEFHCNFPVLSDLLLNRRSKEGVGFLERFGEPEDCTRVELFWATQDPVYCKQIGSLVLARCG